MKTLDYKKAVSWKKSNESQTRKKHKVVESKYLDLETFEEKKCYCVILIKESKK